MDEPRYYVGERVLVSRTQDGRGHEEATVVDYYQLLIEGSSIPSVVVDFDDGDRLYLPAREPNVLPLEAEDEPEWDDDERDEEPEPAGEPAGDEPAASE
jgi:hypothetical protein